MSSIGARRVLILWADSDSTNLGVQALAAGSKQLVIAAFPDCEIKFLSYSTEVDRRLRPGAKNLLLASVGLNRILRGWLSSFDLVVDTGAGDSFSDIYGSRRLFEMSALRLLVRRAKVPLVMGPQTIGPFNSKIGRLLAKLSVRGAAAVFARDSAGYRECSRVYEGSTVQASDVAFLIPANSNAERSGILLNVSGLLWNKNPHVDYLFYRQQVEEFARLAITSGLEVTLLSHVLASVNPDSDAVALRALQKNLGGVVGCFEPKDLNEVRSRIAQSEVVVASRMHASLNALSQGVPTVAWGYSDKFRPLLTDLGWSEFYDLRGGNSNIAKDTFYVISELSNAAKAADQSRRLAVNSFNPAIVALQEAVEK